jgi:hypothetical protein
VLTRSLPAVRVAVCKEVSRAMELRVSQQGMQACAAFVLPIVMQVCQ